MRDVRSIKRFAYTFVLRSAIVVILQTVLLQNITCPCLTSACKYVGVSARIFLLSQSCNQYVCCRTMGLPSFLCVCTLTALLVESRNPDYFHIGGVLSNNESKLQFEETIAVTLYYYYKHNVLIKHNTQKHVHCISMLSNYDQFCYEENNSYNQCFILICVSSYSNEPQNLCPHFYYSFPII